MKKTTKALWLIFISVFLAFALVSCALDIPGLSANNPPDNSGEKEPSKNPEENESNPEENESNPEEETKKECTHVWKIVTTEPTCQRGGYDTKTCTLCGQTEKCNEKPSAPHEYQESYENDNTFHWHKCKSCDATNNREEHNFINDTCSVCSSPFVKTEGISYELSENKEYALVIGYTGAATKITVADTYEGKPVKVISDNAFKEKGITSVVLPDTVTQICSNAFSSCANLVSVTIGNNITSVGYRAFYNCNPNLYTIDKKDNGVLAATYVGDANNPYAILLNGHGLCNNINEKTKIIASHAFIGVGDRELIIPDSVTSISAEAFFRSLYNSITVPDSVTSIGEKAFSMCNMLDTVTLGNGIEKINASTFSDCNNMRSIIIPNSVTIIGEKAFDNCFSLEAVTIGNGVTKICQAAFEDCGGITNVNYVGSEEDFSKISIEEKNHTLTNATINYNYTEE